GRGRGGGRRRRRSARRSGGVPGRRRGADRPDGRPADHRARRGRGGGGRTVARRRGRRLARPGRPLPGARRSRPGRPVGPGSRGRARRSSGGRPAGPCAPSRGQCPHRRKQCWRRAPGAADGDPPGDIVTMRSQDSLVISGGNVLTANGLSVCDVFLANGRIVSAGSVVGTSGTGGGGLGEPTEVGTAGAGAERAVLRLFASNETGDAAGGEPPAAPGDSTPCSAHVLDAAGLLVVPGFVDVQCNGAVGVDITADPERLWEVAAALPRWGVTSWLPTVVTAPPAIRARALATLRSGPPSGRDDVRLFAMPLGLHLEGPFLAPERRGAHPAKHL